MARCIVCNIQVKYGNFFCDDCLKKEGGNSNIPSVDIDDVLAILDDIKKKTRTTSDNKSGT